MERSLRLGTFEISDDGPSFCIAEIGHNHQGSLEKAMEMFRAAKDCGANAVKLQKRDNKSLFVKKLYDSSYDNENSFGPTYGEHREALEFGESEYNALKDYARELGILFFATAFDQPSVDFLEKVDVPFYKVASGDLTNLPLLLHIAKTGKPLLLSTGGGNLDDVRRAYEAIMPVNSQLAILQCTAAYPAEPKDMNLRVISAFREAFPETVIGLSDHQSGISMALVAYTLGARIFEKHFTLNRAMKGTDHAFSLEPAGLRKLVRDLHRAREAMGDGIKRQIEIEKKPLYKMGKALVAARPLSAGQQLRPEDVAIKSPADGLPPYELDKVLGKTLTADLAPDAPFTLDQLR
jgi:N-acetylneuraminate synthase/sialic acid synthase